MISDAEKMLEWMHDQNVIEDLLGDFKNKSINDCIEFINISQKDNHNIHLAIVDENNEYMGTVSLKHIDSEKKFAEFAIVIRTCAMGLGYSEYAMKEIMRMAESNYGLKNIYWNVSNKNSRAIRFYDKFGYLRTDEVPLEIKRIYNNSKFNFIWYSLNLETSH